MTQTQHRTSQCELESAQSNKSQGDYEDLQVEAQASLLDAIREYEDSLPSDVRNSVFRSSGFVEPLIL